MIHKNKIKVKINHKLGVTHKKEYIIQSTLIKRWEDLNKLILSIIFFGGIAVGLEFLRLDREKPDVSHIPGIIYIQINDDSDESPQFMDETKRDKEIIKKGREERIKKIRESLQQEINDSFKPPVDKDGKPTPGPKDYKFASGDLKKELESVLYLDQIKDPEKYEKIYDLIDALEKEVNAAYERESEKAQSIEDEMQRLNRIKEIIDADLKDLRKHFEETDEQIKKLQVNYNSINVYLSFFYSKMIWKLIKVKSMNL